jgi:hypothetical protein
MSVSTLDALFSHDDLAGTVTQPLLDETRAEFDPAQLAKLIA